MIRLITYKEFQEILETKDFDYLCKWLKENWLVVLANDYLEQMNLLFDEKYKNYNGSLNDLISSLIEENTTYSLFPYSELEELKKIIFNLNREQWNVLKRIIDDSFSKIEKYQKFKKRENSILNDLDKKLSTVNLKKKEPITGDRFCISNNGVIHMCDKNCL